MKVKNLLDTYGILKKEFVGRRIITHDVCNLWYSDDIMFIKEE